MKKYHKIEKIAFVNDCFELKVDGKEYKFQLADISERLAKATPEERENYEILQSDYGIHWPLIDEDLSIDGLIAVKQPYKPTDIEMAGSPKAFEYEMQMFRWSIQMFECLKNPCFILLNDGIRNSILETALLHARNILEFFTGDQPMKGNLDEDSIRAGYFVDELHKKEGWWKSSNLSYTQSRKTDINKSLSHLTFKRIEETYKWDDLPKIKEEIEAAYIEFLKLLPEEDRVKWPEPKDSVGD